MHRFGQRIKRDILRPETEDYAHGTTGKEVEAEYLQDLRMRIENFEGPEIQEKVDQMGPDVMFDAMRATADDLAAWEKQDPERFERVQEARADALKIYQDQKSMTPMARGQVRT